MLIAIVALYQANLITVHTFECNKFRGKVIPMHWLFGSATRWAWQQTITSAYLTRIRCVHWLHFCLWIYLCAWVGVWVSFVPKRKRNKQFHRRKRNEKKRKRNKWVNCFSFFVCKFLTYKFKSKRIDWNREYIGKLHWTNWTHTITATLKLPYKFSAFVWVHRFRWDVQLVRHSVWTRARHEKKMNKIVLFRLIL